MTRSYLYPFFSDNCLLCCSSCPLTRGRACNLQCNRWLVRSLRTITIRYCLIWTIWDCAPFSSPLTTLRDYGGSIRTRLHTGVLVSSLRFYRLEAPLALRQRSSSTYCPLRRMARIALCTIFSTVGRFTLDMQIHEFLTLFPAPHVYCSFTGLLSIGCSLFLSPQPERLILMAVKVYGNTYINFSVRKLIRSYNLKGTPLGVQWCKFVKSELGLRVHNRFRWDLCMKDFDVHPVSQGCRQRSVPYCLKQNPLHHDTVWYEAEWLKDGWNRWHNVTSVCSLCLIARLPSL
jgi:hypothetical protein